MFCYVDKYSARSPYQIATILTDHGQENIEAQDFPVLFAESGSSCNFYQMGLTVCKIQL